MSRSIRALAFVLAGASAWRAAVGAEESGATAPAQAVQLRLYVHSAVTRTAEGDMRRIDVIPTSGTQRLPVAGSVAAQVDGRALDKVELFESTVGVGSFYVPEVKQPADLHVVLKDAKDRSLEAGARIEPARQFPWREYVKRCLDTLIEHGTDHYGPVHTPMLMSILDVYTYDSPETPPLLDAYVRTEERPDHGRRSPGGSNLYLDMPTLEVMYRMSELTSDPRYARAADAYIHAYLKRAVKPNGMIGWGSHIYYHAYRDRLGGDGDGAGPHEILIIHPDWQRLYELEPAATRREVEGIWQWHIADKQTGLHNRHDDGGVGCDFAFSGGSFSVAFAAMYALTGDKEYLDKARLVASWHWENRNRQTNLTADCPNLKDRYDGQHCFTTLPGPHASLLLRCYELTREPYFRDAAIGHIKAYDRYGWDEAARNYHGMLKLDGTPVPRQPRGEGYDIWQPTGHIDMWRTTMYSYEMPMISAQTAVYAHRLCEDAADRKALLAIAKHWATAIEGQWPPKPGWRWKAEIEKTLPPVTRTGGTYAENYGRAISFFVGLSRISGDEDYLRRARSLAQEAVDKLYVNGLFQGHPAKPYYQTNDGVGFLLHALMELDALPEEWRLAF